MQCLCDLDLTHDIAVNDLEFENLAQATSWKLYGVGTLVEGGV